MKERILIAGIGNIFLGDDAFGVEVVQRLAGKLPDSVRVVDFGIRGFDLAYALMDGYDVTILVDAVHRDGAPGTLYTIEPDLQEAQDPTPESFEAHSLDPMKILAMARAMAVRLNRVLVVGCEPASLGDEEGGRMGLSPTVEAAVDEAIKMIVSLVTKRWQNHRRVPERSYRQAVPFQYLRQEEPHEEAGQGRHHCTRGCWSDSLFSRFCSLYEDSLNVTWLTATGPEAILESQRVTGPDR